MQHKELRRVFYDLQNQDLFIMAYGNLYANKGAMTLGTNPEDSIDGMSIRKIDRVIQSLNDGTFKWQPAKRIYIPKANGKMRPLSIPGWTDKLVQEAIRQILEAYYEPGFSEYSHGFRPNRGCHTALIDIKKKWSGTTWFIEGDIQGCFDNINHETLLHIMGMKIKDIKFLQLIKEMLKAGYMEDWKYQETYSGTPQGGVLSPLLANIYLNELDKFVEKLLQTYNKGTSKPINPEYRKISQEIAKARTNRQWDKVERLSKERRELKSQLVSPEFRRLKYIRYADDFALGFNGTKLEAESIKESIREHSLNVLKLEMSEEKTKITHAASEKARFLGYEISVEWNNQKLTNGLRSINGKVMLRVPKDVREKWMTKYQENGKSIQNSRMLMDTDYDIISTYESEVRGIINYYSLAVNVSTLHNVKWGAEQSLVKTLATKHKQGSTWVYKNYQIKSPDGLNCIEVKIAREGKPALIARFGGKPIRYKKDVEINDRISAYRVYSDRTQLEQRLMADECENCGSRENVQVHHIKSIKTVIQKYRKRGTEMPWWIKHMAENYRKTIVVCEECHRKIHKGEYDGRKLT